MIAFTVTVRQLDQAPGQGQTLPAIGTDSAAVHMSMIDIFGACLIFVTPAAK